MSGLAGADRAPHTRFVVHVRPAIDADYDAYARLFPELGVDEPARTRAQFEAQLRARTIVATLDQAVVGYAMSEVLEGVGYIRNIVTDPEYRRRGIGRVLMEHLAVTFVSAGATQMCLNVKPDNVAALRLYASFGLQVVYASDTVRVDPGTEPWGFDVELEVGPLDPGDDAMFEDRFDLLRGQLGSARARLGEGVLGIRLAGEPVAVAAFDRAFAGAFPFRVARPELGPTVVEHLRRRAAPEAPFVQVVVENDPPLRETLLARGARHIMHFLHLRGPL